MFPKLLAHCFFNGTKIFFAACCEVVEADNFLIQLQKTFHQMGPDKASAPGD